MATSATICELSQHVGQTVTLRGWLYNSRSSGKLMFLVVRDGTGLCQCVLEKTDATAGLFETARRLGQESSLAVTGTVRAGTKILTTIARLRFRAARARRPTSA